MRIRLLGCHHTETDSARLSSFLIDEALALDAGALTSTLSHHEQSAIQAVLVTHEHLDHIRDIPVLALNGLETGKPVSIYGLSETLASVQRHLLKRATFKQFRSDAFGVWESVSAAAW